MADDAITTEEEQQVDGLYKELKRKLKTGERALELVLLQLESMTGISRSATHEPDDPLTYPRASARRLWFTAWYQKLGFELSIPTPHITDNEFKSRAKKHQALFYRPPTTHVSYEDFMRSVEQGADWTVVNKKKRAKIKWEPAETGYWFWADTKPSCPRLKTSWNDLIKAHHLLSLEEYVIIWWAVKTKNNKLLDTSTWSWLRTQIGRSAISVNEYDGVVNIVSYHDLMDLAFSYDDGGGRAAEVVTG